MADDDIETTTVEVDRDYLWALEVLACDSLGIDGQTSRDHDDRYGDAIGIARDRNGLSRPRDRYLEDG